MSSNTCRCSHADLYGRRVWVAHALIAPVEAALRTVPGGMLALEGPAKCLVALATPERLDWLLEDVAQHAFLPILFGVPVSKGSKTV